MHFPVPRGLTGRKNNPSNPGRWLDKSRQQGPHACGMYRPHPLAAAEEPTAAAPSPADEIATARCRI